MAMTAVPMARGLVYLVVDHRLVQLGKVARRGGSRLRWRRHRAWRRKANHWLGMGQLPESSHATRITSASLTLRPPFFTALPDAKTSGLRLDSKVLLARQCLCRSGSGCTIELRGSRVSGHTEAVLRGWRVAVLVVTLAFYNRRRPHSWFGGRTSDLVYGNQPHLRQSMQRHNVSRNVTYQ